MLLDSLHERHATEQEMIRLADFDVYATDEGLFIVGDSDVATKVAGPQTAARRLAPELAEAWNDVRGDAGSITPVESKKRTTSRTARSTGDYDLGSSSEKTNTGSKSHGDYDPTEDRCDSCDSTNVQQVGGCPVCQECGWSKC